MTSKVQYTNNLHCELTHIRSGTVIASDAPIDNQGKGEAFSPTDLVATASASCALTTIGIAARTHNFTIENATAEVIKLMASDPRRIAEVKIIFRFPFNNYSEKEKTIIENTARTCPVMLSLSSEVKRDLTFLYG
jgi:uncharacterized OsmC-like protein